MPYGSTPSPRTLFAKLICFVLLFTLSGLWALAGEYSEALLPPSNDYYAEEYVPSLTHGPFARARAEASGLDAYHYASDSFFLGNMITLAPSQDYLSFITQEPIYPLHIALLAVHPEIASVSIESGKNPCAPMERFSRESKLYRFSSGCNVPVYLGASNVLFSEPLGATYLGKTFESTPVLATPEPASIFIYITLGVLTVCVLRRRIP